VQESLREAKKPPKIAKPADVAAVVDSAAFAYELEDALAEEMTIGYGEAIGELGLGLGFDVLPKDALKYLSTHIDEFAASVAQGEREGVLTFIRSALTDGVGAHELGVQLKDYFAEGVHRVAADGSPFVMNVDAWADNVARTELSRAYNGGKRDLYESAGLKEWMWVAANDDRTCDICMGLDGEVVVIGEPFSTGDEQPPDPHSNCLCTLVASPDAMDTINADRADAGDAGDAGDETVMESIGRRLREDWVTINGEHVLIGGDGKVDSAGMASYGGGKGSTRQAVSIAMRALTKTGGFTVSIHGVVPTHGYMIAGEIDEEQHALAGTRASLRDAITTFATKHNALLGNNERYIGGWAEKHAVFLDVSQRLAVSRSAALQTAREQDQIAVWHLDKKETVYTMSDHLHPSESKGHILESVRPVESDDGAENDGVAFMIAPGENIDDAAKKIADAWAEKFDMP